MARRLALVIGAIALVMMLGTLWSAGAALNAHLGRDAAAGLVTRAREQARQLQARLLAAEAVAESASGGDAGAGGAVLRQRALRGGAFRGAVVLTGGQIDGGGPRAPLKLGAAERLALAGGQTLMRSVSTGAGSRALYLVRATTQGGIPAVAFFELAPDWMWSGFTAPAGGGVLVVVDGSGALLAASSEIPADLAAALVRERDVPAEPDSEPAMRAWQVGGSEWRGAVAPLHPSQLFLEAPRWSIIASAVAPGGGALALLAPQLPWLLLGLAVLVAAATFHLRQRWEPVLDATRRRRRAARRRLRARAAARGRDAAGATARPSTARSTRSRSAWRRSPRSARSTACCSRAANSRRRSRRCWRASARSPAATGRLSRCSIRTRRATPAPTWSPPTARPSRSAASPPIRRCSNTWPGTPRA
ncbi:MAG: hypothetical protein U1F06_02975 [Steroidobacteraceae bacterium]